jgi:hypothetical protein
MSKREENKTILEKGESAIRATFYQRLLYLTLCIIPIWYFADEKPPISYVVLLFFLTGMYQLLVILKLSQSITDDFFPPKVLFEKKLKSFDKFIYRFANIFFLLSLVFLLFEIRTIDNTLNGMTLFLKSGFVGVVFAIFVTLILKKTNPSVYFESKRRFVVHSGLFIDFFLFFSALASFINHYFAYSNEICETHLIVDKSTSGRKKNSFLIFLKLNNNTQERFDVSKAFYEQVEAGENCKLCTKKGKLGYDFVTEFRALN